MIFKLLILSILIGCTPQDESTTKETAVDPNAPGSGSGDSTRLLAPIAFSADTSVDSQVTLSWQIPNVYSTLDYELYLYKAAGSTFTLPDPSETYSSAYLYTITSSFTPITSGSTYLETNSQTRLNINAGSTYRYFAYLKIGDKWSTGADITVTIPSTSGTTQIPSQYDFWPSYIISYASAPTGGTYVNTLGPEAVVSGIRDGYIASNDDGSLMFVSDTVNNRVIIYATGGYQACNGYDKTSDDYEICVFAFQGYPLSAWAVLGQADFTTTYSCQDGSNTLGTESCMTKPRGVRYKDDRLFVTDSGNDRILVFNTIPYYACWNMNKEAGNTTPLQCAADTVIGKKSVDDTATYSLAIDGIAALNSPSAIAFNGNNAYIADTGNNRVVYINNFLNSTWNCSGTNWKSSLCDFDGVLGQRDLNTNEYFKYEFDLGNITYNNVSGDFSDSDFLQRHIRNPSKIEVTTSGEIYIQGQEDFSSPVAFGDIALRTRIAYLSTSPIEGTIPICSDSTFDSGGCDFEEIIGQEYSSRPVFINTGGKYTDTNYAISDGDFDIISDSVLITDSATNKIYIYNDWKTISGLGIPYSYAVSDPNGSFDADTSRSLPDLNQICAVHINQYTKKSYIYDCAGSKFYEVPLYDNSL